MGVVIAQIFNLNTIAGFRWEYNPVTPTQANQNFERLLTTYLEYSDKVNKVQLISSSDEILPLLLFFSQLKLS